MTTLSVVATPIGNLEDITLRALRVLKEADLILCEDTRVTKKLLSHYGIRTPTLSYHARSGVSKINRIIALLEEGKNLALVSDAGTPTISDPGSTLVRAVRSHSMASQEVVDGFDQRKKLSYNLNSACKAREHFGESVAVVAIPGPSAVAAALSVAGVPASEFLFLGFLPHKKGRRTLFGEIARSKRVVVFYESPHRIMKTLESLQTHAGDRRVEILRELTKIYEEALEGTPAMLLDRFTRQPEKQRGEFVVIVAP